MSVDITLADVAALKSEAAQAAVSSPHSSASKNGSLPPEFQPLLSKKFFKFLPTLKGKGRRLEAKREE